MAKKKTQKVLIFEDGTKFPVLTERGRYYVCENTQFRKCNPRIVKIEEIKEDKKHADC